PVTIGRGALERVGEPVPRARGDVVAAEPRGARRAAIVRGQAALERDPHLLARALVGGRARRSDRDALDALLAEACGDVVGQGDGLDDGARGVDAHDRVVRALRALDAEPEAALRSRGDALDVEADGVAVAREG